jgi:DNA-binding MarR family transcriptional regulator
MRGAAAACTVGGDAGDDVSLYDRGQVQHARPASPKPKAAATELVDVVNVVAQAVWANMRRSPQAIEPSQWATLRRLADGPCTMGELARHKDVSLPTMSKSVEMLVRRGWVERAAVDGDRRRTSVRLTADGRRILAECRRRSERMLEAKLASLTPQEREQVAASLELLHRALSGGE